MTRKARNQEIARIRCSRIVGLLFAFFPILAPLGMALSGFREQTPAAEGISRAAAESCAAKVSRMEAFADAPDPSGKLDTRLSQNELNSYLALNLSSYYHPSLKSILVKLEAEHLQAVATIDFDRLEFNSTRMVTGLFRSMLAGIHTLTIRGTLVADQGKGSFRLDEAQFDSFPLPNWLVEEIITQVGKKQNPPFDPMQPSDLPYRIRKVDVRPGYIIVTQ